MSAAALYSEPTGAPADGPTPDYHLMTSEEGAAHSAAVDTALNGSSVFGSLATTAASVAGYECFANGSLVHPVQAGPNPNDTITESSQVSSI